MKTNTYFISCAKGLEILLKEELARIGIEAYEKLAGVEFDGTLEQAYKACIHSHLASQVMLKIATAKTETQEELYNFISDIEWDSYFDVDKSFKIAVSGKHYDFNNTMFVSQKAKRSSPNGAILWYFRGIISFPFKSSTPNFSPFPIII